MSDKQVRAQYTREYKLEAIRQLRGGQSITATAKVLGIPKASLSNWVRQSAKGVDVGGHSRQGGRRHTRANGVGASAR
jgi:transposase